MPFGNATFTNAGAAVSDLYAADAHRSKAEGDRIEAQNYGLAADFAGQNVLFTQESTTIKAAQQDRALQNSLGKTTAAVTGAGLQLSGSAIDILRDSASQGSLTRSVLTQQGAITEAGYAEQQQSYLNLQKAANVAADAEDHAAQGSDIAAGISGIASVATLFIK